MVSFVTKTDVSTVTVQYTICVVLCAVCPQHNVVYQHTLRHSVAVSLSRLWTNFKEVEADSVIIATGASARKLPIPGLDKYWNAGISACAVCDGSSPLFRCVSKAHAIDAHCTRKSLSLDA